jgi:hypothetical protein
MGIRVHKVIGYGLTDLKCKKYKVVDPRIDPTGYLGDYENQEAFSRKGYLAFLKAKLLTASEDEKHEIEWELAWFKGGGLAPHLKDWTPYETVKHQAEYGLPKVLVVCPPEMVKSWQHYDDTIDFYEETINHKQHNRFQMLPNGAYPYEGSYMDARTGERVKDGIELRRIMTGMIKLSAEIKDKFSRQFGFDDFKTAKKFLVPTVPNSVRYVCEYLKLFKDPATVNSLRPMIYVYWS